MKLFVYGTLRRGEPAHALLKDAPFVAEVRTEPRFELVDMDGYPALIEGGATAVSGEIYEVGPELLVELDRYEDVPQLYQHAWLTIGGHHVLAYLLPAVLAVGRPRLASGDWRAR
jgi:gamma-glutamylaminecyclotransferase